jgi:hypothetical protein
MLKEAEKRARLPRVLVGIDEPRLRSRDGGHAKDLIRVIHDDREAEGGAGISFPQTELLEQKNGVKTDAVDGLPYLAKRDMLSVL